MAPAKSIERFAMNWRICSPNSAPDAARIRPHGPEWRAACHELGIGDESRCHNLPFPVRPRTRRYLYKCPHCQRDFSRVRRIKRVVACLPCCRAHNRGKFAAKFRLQLVRSGVKT